MAPSGTGKSAAPPLSEIVAFLSTPAAYGRTSGAIEARETHMSWVFLTPDRVFKLKKPVKASFLDYTTLAARERFCREEVRLNKRLAPAVYLGVVPVTMNDSGPLAVDGGGETIDWLVEMRRLPADRMLDHAIRSGVAKPQEIECALELLFGFFASAPPADVGEERFLATLSLENRENHACFSRPECEAARDDALALIDTVQALIETAPAWLLDPVARRRIIEGHGDLRPEHICLTDPPVVIDCLEFSLDLRLVDPFDELSYLALECRLLGAHDLADSLVERYAARIGAMPPRLLLDFYTAHRAIVRARLALSHIGDFPNCDPERWTTKARAYLDAAGPATIRLRDRSLR